MVDDNKPLSVSDIEQKEQKIQTMLENNQNPVTEVSEQGAVQATVESLNNCMIPQGSATPDSNSSINAVVPNGTASSGTLLSGTVLQNSYLNMWDGEPLSEGKLYHRNEMIGLPECSIMENRDFWGRAEEWQKKCREVGMAQPAKYVRARLSNRPDILLHYSTRKKENGKRFPEIYWTGIIVEWTVTDVLRDMTWN